MKKKGASIVKAETFSSVGYVTALSFVHKYHTTEMNDRQLDKMLLNTLGFYHGVKGIKDDAGGLTCLLYPMIYNDTVMKQKQMIKSLFGRRVHLYLDILRKNRYDCGIASSVIDVANACAHLQSVIFADMLGTMLFSPFTSSHNIDKQVAEVAIEAWPYLKELSFEQKKILANFCSEALDITFGNYNDD